MSIDKILKNAEVFVLENSAEHMRGVIQKRLEYIEERCGVEPGSLIQVSDGAYQAIAEVSHCSPGLALQVMKMVVPTAEQVEQTHPYIITEDHIRQLNLTYEALCRLWDSPFRDATVIRM